MHKLRKDRGNFFAKLYGESEKMRLFHIESGRNSDKEWEFDCNDKYTYKTLLYDIAVSVFYAITTTFCELDLLFKLTNTYLYQSLYISSLKMHKAITRF